VIALAYGSPVSAFPMQDAVAAAPAAAPAAAEELRAVFIDVNGQVQWRADDKSPWTNAAVNDVIKSGVEVRTGIRARAAIRVGRNATILMDGGTNVSIPTVMQEGEVLKTTASVRSGRADFKVDRVGLTNDFRVVTPSTTLAVRGTEFAVATGALKQLEIVGAKTNVINAIELKYALNNQTVQLSGGATSSTGVQNPVHAALVSAAPPTIGTAPKSDDKEVVKDAVSGPAPVDAGSAGSTAKQNAATGRAEAASGSTEGSVAAGIQRSVQLANERTALAIEYMIQAASAADAVSAQKDVLAALKQLANARHAEAMAALSAHQAALNSVQGNMQSVMNHQGVINQLSSQLNSHLSDFGSQHNSASVLLSKIESVIASEGSGDLRVLAEQAAAALMGMNGALESAQGAISNIGAQLAIVNSIVAGIDANTRPAAAAAAVAYQSAMANLQALAAAGASPAQLAAAAQSAVANLQGLIAGLAGQAQTQAALAAASQALTALANANHALAQSQAALAAIQAARDQAGNDVRAAQLGMVEQLYQQIVAVRAAMATSMMAQAGLVDAADAQADETNSYAESVFALLGGYWRDVAVENRDAAISGAAAAAQADVQAVAAHNDFNQAVNAAEGALAGAQTNLDQATTAAAGVSSAHGNLNQAAANAMESLGNIAQYGNPAMESALLALDALEQALGQILSQYSNFEGIVGQQPSGADLAGVQAQGAAALEALLAAISNAQAAANQANGGAAGAADAADAAAAVQALALQLAERFGLNMEGALAAAAQAYAEALAAGGAAGAAGASLQHAEALALLAHAETIGNIAAQIDALLAQSNNLSSTALAQLQAAQNSYVGVNEYGTQVFAGLTHGASDDAVTNQLAAQASMASLTDMAISSTAYVAALDGAEGAARGAELSEKGARLERRNAERHEAGAQFTFGQMNRALGNDNWDIAVGFGNRTIHHAGLADGAANSSAGYAQEAAGYYQTAVNYGNAADALQATIDQYGLNSAQFASAAGNFAGQVNTANQAMADIQAQANFYDSVAQMLAGRANTDPALAAAIQSGDSRAQVVAIAAQLAASAQDAATLEQTARSNAERMFFRSARQYVERAGEAANRALIEADMARAAADRAAELAAQAAAATGGGSE
jgi:hypothetical protein